MGDAALNFLLVVLIPKRLSMRARRKGVSVCGIGGGSPGKRWDRKFLLVAGLVIFLWILETLDGVCPWYVGNYTCCITILLGYRLPNTNIYIYICKNKVISLYVCFTCSLLSHIYTKEEHTGAANHPEPGVSLQHWYSAPTNPLSVVRSMLLPPITTSRAMEFRPSC